MAGLSSLAKDTAIYGLSSIVGRFLNYLLVPLYTATLSAAGGGYGVITNVYAYTALLLVILTYGMETTFFRFANKEGEDPQRVYSTALLSVGATSLAFAVLVVAFVGPISAAMGYADHPSYVWVMAVTVALDAFQCIPFAYLRYKKRPVKFAALKLANILMSIALNLVFFLALPAWYESTGGEGLVGRIYSPEVGVGYAFYVNLFCSAALMLLLVKELTGFRYVFDRALLRRMLTYAWPILVLGIAGILNQTADKILFPYVYRGADAHAQLGIYGAASKIAMIMAMITQAFRYAYEPFVFGKAKDRDNRETYAKAMKYFVIFTLLAFLAVVGYMDILRHLIGRDYWEGLGVVPIVMDHDGRLLQPVVLVQAHRQDHLGRLVLGSGLPGAHPRQRAARSPLRLHGLRVGRLRRLRHGNAALLLRGTEALPHQLPRKGHHALRGRGRRAVPRDALLQPPAAGVGRRRRQHGAAGAVRRADSEARLPARTNTEEDGKQKVKR